MLLVSPRPLRCRLDVVHVKHVHTLLDEDVPDHVASLDRPRGQVPVPRLKAPVVRLRDLRPDPLDLVRAQLAHPYRTDASAEGHTRVVRVVVAVGRRAVAELGERRVVEVVAVRRVGVDQLLEGGVARADDRHGPRVDSPVGVVAQPVALAKRLELRNHFAPGASARTLDVHKERQRLVWRRVEDAAVAAAPVIEAGRRVGALQDLDQRLDVEGLKRSIALQRGLVMAHVQFVGVVQEPDVGLDARATLVEGREERHFSPVVVVRVDGLGHNVL